MRKKIVTVALVGTLGLGAGALLSPTLAAASTGTVSNRLTAIQNALKGLVGDHTLTQAQADKVATTLDGALPRGPVGMDGHRGLRLGREDLATILGVTPQELRTALQGGKTLAQVAADKHISKSDLITKLVAAAKTELTEAVKDGRLTQAQADSMTSTLQARVTARVDRPGFGPGGHRDGPDAGPSGATPSSMQGEAPIPNG